MASDNASLVGENLTRTFRLRKASDFVRLLNRAKIFKEQGFLIRHLDNQHGHARLGIAVSKKRVKHAVKRNRIKRIVRETFRKNCLKLPSKDYVVSYKGAQNLNNATSFCKNLNRFWQREATTI